MREELDGVRRSMGKLGGCGEPAQDPRMGSPASWTGDSCWWGRIRVEEMPWYLLVLLRYRKHPRVAASTTPTRTPTVTAIFNVELPVLVFSAERRKESGEG